MQVIDLIWGLTSDERKALLSRRGLEQTSPKADDQALARALSEPRSLQYAFLDLSIVQLGILRWLATQPGYRAPWWAFRRAVGNRLPEPNLAELVADLRLCGLVDYSSARQEGFIATYAAAVGALPGASRNLRGVLAQLGTETLRLMCTRLGLSKPPGDREGRLDLLLGRLSDRGFCRDLVSRLAPDARELFAAVRAAGGRLSIEEVARRTKRPISRYRAYPESYYHGYEQPGLPLDAMCTLVAHGLLVTLASDPYGWSVTAVAVPEEVDRALSDESIFDTIELTPPLLLESHGVEGREPSPSRLLRDIAHLLGFIAAGRCEWRQDGEPYQRSFQALGKALKSPDKDYPPLLWALCLAAGLIHHRGSATALAVKSTAWPDPDALYRRVVTGWARGGSAAGTPYAPYPSALRRTRLLNILADAPTDTWIDRGSYERVLQFWRPLVFGAEDAAQQAALREDLEILRHMLVATGVDEDGDAAIMMAGLVARLLRAEPSQLPPWDESWVVQADRTVMAPPNAHPQALVDLWGIAELEQNQEAAIFRLSSGSVANALNRGVSPGEIKDILAKRSRAPLPDGVVRLIDDQGRRYGQVRVGPAQAYVRSEDPGLIEELVHSRKLGHLHWRQLAPGVAGVERASPTAVIQALRQAGFLPVLEAGDGHQPPARGQLEAKASPTPWARHVLATWKRAVKEDLAVDLKWRDGGRTRRATVYPVAVKGTQLDAVQQDTEDWLVVDLGTVEYAVLVPDDDFDDDDLDDEEY